MRELISLTGNGFLNQMILALVCEDHVDSLCGRSANIWAKHDIVIRLSSHVLLVEAGRKNFNISTSTIQFLGVLH